MSGGPIWYELVTPDPAAAAAFYGATIGWTIPGAGSAMPNGAEYRMIGRSDGGFAGGVLTLTDEMRAHGARPGWLVYVHVADVAAAVARAQDLGGTLWMGPTEMEAGTMAMLSDPQGAPFYLMTPTPPPGRPDAKSDVFDPRAPERCAWNELNTSDAKGAIAFYGDLLDWSLTDDMPMPGDNIYRFIDCDGQRIGAICSMMAPGYSPSFLPYFRVADIEAAKAAVAANGGTVAMGPMEVPGGGRVLVARDPGSAWVGLVAGGE